MLHGCYDTRSCLYQVQDQESFRTPSTHGCYESCYHSCSGLSLKLPHQHSNVVACAWLSTESLLARHHLAAVSNDGRPDDITSRLIRIQDLAGNAEAVFEGIQGVAVAVGVLMDASCTQNRHMFSNQQQKQRAMKAVKIRRALH